MFGCCEVAGTRFKNERGEVDQVRLAKLVSEKRAAGWDAPRLEKLDQCQCPCHDDGTCVFC